MRSFAVVLVLTSVALSSPVQTRSGSIVGRVYDSATKDSIPLATVIIVGSTLGAATDEQGHFIISHIPPGTYEVQASAVGYAPLVQRDVVVRASKEVEVSFYLTEQSIQVGEILVTGKQFVVPDLPLSTEYLSYKEIQNTAGAFDDVVRTVSSLPGVVQTRSDRNDLMVRGGGTSENLFLIDNIEFPNIDHFGTEGTSGGSVSFVNLDFVENASFSAGGFGVRYGDKLSSVLSIDMRDARKDENRVKADVSATEAGLNLEGPIADGGGYLFSARRSYLDPVFKYYGFAFAPYYWDFLAKGTYQFGDDDKIEALGIGAIDKIRFFNDTKSNQVSNSQQLFSNQNEAVGGITWRHGFGWGYSMLTARTSYSDFNYLQKGDTLVQLNAGNPHVSNISSEQETSIGEDVEIQLTKSTEFALGAEGRIARLKTAMDLQALETGFTQDPKVLAIKFSRDTSAHKAGAYAQLSQIIGNLTLT
ncbi:MAG: TonB-dependent receptor, partial [Bacteroidota bacterium]